MSGLFRQFKDRIDEDHLIETIDGIRGGRATVGADQRQKMITGMQLNIKHLLAIGSRKIKPTAASFAINKNPQIGIKAILPGPFRVLDE